MFTKVNIKLVTHSYKAMKWNDKHNDVTFTVEQPQLSKHFINLKNSKDQHQCVILAALNSEYIMFRTGNVVRYLMLYAPAPSSWPMPDRLASKSWASPDSITSSVRGNFRAHAMATIRGSDGVGSRLNTQFNLYSQIVICVWGMEHDS